MIVLALIYLALGVAWAVYRSATAPAEVRSEPLALWVGFALSTAFWPLGVACALVLRAAS